MRNPNWHRDEIILALDLYLRLEQGQIHKNNPRVQELSELLRRLPIHRHRVDELTFRNPNGVSMKLSNFLAIDPSYGGTGMRRHSKLDEEIFKEFKDDKDRLHSIAKRIREVGHDLALIRELDSVPSEQKDEYIEVKEGEMIYKLHRYRERNSKIIKKKKEKEFERHGKLSCEVCSFDFFQTYGQLGYKFIECHHRTPLSEFSSSSTTTLDDLALVCSNCHRMLHRELDTLTVEGLKNLLST